MQAEFSLQPKIVEIDGGGHPKPNRLVVNFELKCLTFLVSLRNFNLQQNHDRGCMNDCFVTLASKYSFLHLPFNVGVVQVLMFGVAVHGSIGDSL